MNVINRHPPDGQFSDSRLLPDEGNSVGSAIPIAAKAAIASALRPACQVGQQREWSQAWPVDSVPKGRIGSGACRRRRSRDSAPVASARSCG
jgi:hypothetical protein